MQQRDKQSSERVMRDARRRWEYVQTKGWDKDEQADRPEDVWTWKRCLKLAWDAEKIRAKR